MHDERSQVRRATAWRRPTAGGTPEGGLRAAEKAVPEAAEAEHDLVGEGCGADPSALKAGRLYRRVSGRDDRARPVGPEELAGLGDPMAAEFFHRDRFPMTVRELLSGLPEAAAASRRVYLVGEAGQIAPDASPGLHRDMRFAITAAVRAGQPDLLISTQAGGDQVTAFLQVAAWDPGAKVFNFYMRVGPAWVWAGNSWDALEPDSRGKGCFDSHVNGSVVMKELRIPWINWQSERATIRLADDDPLRRDPLYQEVTGAQKLELTVRSLVTRWTAARLAGVTANGVVEHPDRLLRHLFTTTTVNLACTDRQSSVVTPESADLVLPMGFWLNQDVLLDDLGLVTRAAPPTAPAARYCASLTRFGFRMEERAEDGSVVFHRPGDTFFAFVVPEAAHEDNEVVRQMIRHGLLSAKFAACVLMVDFPNPVFSPPRAHLMRYAPTAATEPSALCDRTALAITDAARTLPADSPEGLFAAHWRVPDDAWQAVFGQRVDAYLRKAAARARTEDGFDDYVRLAESRRRRFRAMRLNEFQLTLPVTGIPADAPPLTMREDATTVPLP
ncbi:hypothetical protein [Streptomyces sp. Tu 3180]|uniref:hypothetical protein n=1 Tax=Streptomyces sp. Tu 3180 TaxID=2682611 RepID=UPI0013587B6A|nr:hypothetical protein [Streptomyces sp. Tu 3180]KAF3469195.1 hypothetical protein GL259_36230 [Streptomyces sp. Tu 3180]